MKAKAQEMEAFLLNENEKMVQGFKTAIARYHKAEKNVMQESVEIQTLIKEMTDEDSDKEAVFHKLQQMGFAFDGNEFVLQKSGEALKELEEAASYRPTYDAAGLAKKVAEYQALDGSNQSAMAQFNAILNNSKLTPEIEKQLASAGDIAQATKPMSKAEMQKIVDQIKSKGSL